MYTLSEQQLQALDLESNLAVTAGAGSGKTTLLVNRYLHILLNFKHLSVKNLLAITFTEKATAEMKDRIFDLIRQQFIDNRSKQGRLFEILNELHESQIYTIHAFCSHILRQYPLESELNPDFTILTNIEIDELINRVFREFLISLQLAKHQKARVMMRTFREFPSHRLREMLFFFYHKRTQLYPFLESFANKSPQLIESEWKNNFITYHSDFLEPLMNNASFWDNLKELSALEIETGTHAFKIQSELKQLLENYRKNSTNEYLQISALINILNLLTKGDHGAYTAVPGGKKGWGEIGVEYFRKLSTSAAEFAFSTIPYQDTLEEISATIQKGISLIIIEILKKIEGEKQRLNMMDFDDLQIHCLKLLQMNPEIRNHLCKQYKFLLVDEYQDTDLLQNHIIQLLSHDQLGNLDSNKVFIVGDPKQSIYGFRNADVSLFKNFMTEISLQTNASISPNIDNNDTIEEERKSKRIIHLDQNYRSSSKLIHFFNKTFESIFEPVSEFEVEFQSLQATRQEDPGYNSGVQLDILLDENSEKSDAIIEQAKNIAHNIINFVNHEDHKKYVKGKDRFTYETISFGDIAVLIRSRTHLNQFEQIFRQYEIPYQTYKGIGFFQRQEVQDIYYLLKSITIPEDNFALITVLRSDFIGLSDVSLFYLSQFKGDNYWEKLHKMYLYFNNQENQTDIFNPEFAQYLKQGDQSINIFPDELNIIQNVLTQYPGWHHLAINGQYSRLLDEIIEKLNIRALLKFNIDGPQKLANLDKLIHTIFEYEYSSSISSSELLGILKKQISGEVREGEADILAPEEDKVKILTYHSAKGMEFPVVFLPMLEKQFQYNRQILKDNKYGFAFMLERSRKESKTKPFAYQFLKKRDEQNICAEEKRLFYVASTRAKDFLYLLGTISAKNNLPQESYLYWLFKSYEISEESIKEGNDLPDLDGDTGFIVKIHEGETEDLTKGSGSGSDTQAEPSLQIKTHDIENINPLIEKPALQTYSVTQLMIFREDEERYVQHFYLNDGKLKASLFEMEFVDEPGGEMWGSLVHKMLEYYYRRSPEEDLDKLRQLARIFDFNFEDKKILKKLTDILEKVRAAEFNKKLNPKETSSEFSIELRLDNFVLKGIFDLLYKNSKGLREIIDFKTNRIKASETSGLAKKYAFQMRTYALLLANLYPDQQIYPISLLFTEPMKKEEYSFNLLEIEETRLETIKLLNKIYQYENTIFHPSSLKVNKKIQENKI